MVNGQIDHNRRNLKAHKKQLGDTERVEKRMSIWGKYRGLWESSQGSDLI